MATKMLSTKLFKRPSAYSPWSASAVVAAGDSLVFTTGLTARDLHGAIVGPDDIDIQTRRVFELLGGILAEAGSSLQDVVSMTVFLKDIEADVAAVQAIRNEIWPSDPPVSSTTQVGRLVSEEIRIEIAAIAAIRSSPR
ncbi:MAG: RidA family protein [Burkholderiaceae bacterium]